MQKGGAGSSLSNISRGLARAAEGVGQAVGQGSRSSSIPSSPVSSYLRRNLPSMRSSEVSSILRQPRSLQTPLPVTVIRRQPVMGTSAMRRQASLPSAQPSEVSSLVSKLGKTSARAS